MKTTLAAAVPFALLTALAFPREAHAEDGALPPAPRPQEPDKVAVAEPTPAFKPLAITLNPLSFAVMRIGANLEYLPTQHHGIMVNPFVQSISVGSDPLSTSYTNFGGELGYHYYTGTKGANGFFIGPSLVFMSSSVTSKMLVNNQPRETEASGVSYGAALDVGGQHVFDNGFTIGGGAGVMYLASTATATNAQSSSTANFQGLVPRILFTVGYSL